MSFLWLGLGWDNTNWWRMGCPAAQFPGREESEVTKTATLLTDVNDTLKPQRVRFCGTKNQETRVFVLALVFYSCVSLGKSPDLSGHWFPHFEMEAIG